MQMESVVLPLSGLPTTKPKLAIFICAVRVHKKITPLEAWSKLGIYRLSGRIFDLKEQGVGITTTKTDVVNAFGEKCSVALYELTSVPDGMIEF